ADDASSFRTLSNPTRVGVRQTQGTSQTKTWSLVERAVVTLKNWRLLRKLRYGTTRITSLVQAVLTLHLTCAN
ncbi:hypothetical protein ACNFRZ_16840, partial [Streptomyces sp. CAS3]